MNKNLYNQTACRKSPADSDISFFHTNHLALSAQSPLFFSALVAIVTLVTFLNVLNADFVAWDDNWCVYNNPNLGGVSLRNLYLLFTDTIVSSGFYTPLNGLRWCITYHLFGLDPFWYHFGNWLIHGANAVLIFLILRKLLLSGSSRRGEVAANRTWITVSAALGSLIWSVHPLRVSVVAWVSAGGYGQMLLFLLISLMCYLKANENTTRILSRRLYLLISITSFAASLLSQPFGVSFIVVFFLIDVYLLRRLGGSRGWVKTAAARRVLLEKVPFFAVALIVVLVNFIILLFSSRGGHENVPLVKFGLTERFMQAMYIWAYYAWRPWYPVNLSPVYTTFVHFNPFSPPFIGSLLVVVSTITALFFLRHRWPLGLALGICHLVLLVPALGLLEQQHYHSDRYSLIVSLCWSVLLAAWLAVTKIRRMFRYTVLCLLIAAIVTLSLLSYRQTRVWNNSVTLFQHMIRFLDDNTYRRNIYWELGEMLEQQNKTDEAIENYKRILQIVPDHPIALYKIALIYYNSGNYSLAIPYFNRFLRQRPDAYDANYYIGVAYLQQTQVDKAIKHFDRVLLLRPTSIETHNALGIAYTRKGEYDMAIQHFNEALRFEPANPKVIKNLNKVLKKKEVKSSENH